jgi:hypothetical protein
LGNKKSEPYKKNGSDINRYSNVEERYENAYNKTFKINFSLKTEIMTRTLLADLELYASRVHKYYETYKNYATTIQSELSAANASQQQYEDEAEETRQIDEDVKEAKSVTRLKKKEWELIEKKEEQDEGDRREVERNKPMLQILQQIQAQMQLMQQQPAAAVPGASGVSSSASSTAPTATVPVGATTTRLPQRQIRHFKGDILEWTSFWETFNATIHTSSIPTVQKFDYLKEYLKGDTRLIVENLELSDVNYQFAIDELKRTYGKKEVLIEAHMEKLDSLQPVKDPKEVTALRHLQLTIQSHITALESLGHPKASFGSYLGRRLRNPHWPGPS